MAITPFLKAAQADLAVNRRSNPFDRFDEPVAVPMEPALPVATSPSGPRPAVAPVAPQLQATPAQQGQPRPGFDMNHGTVEMIPDETLRRMEALRSELAYAFNGGASREAILGIVERHRWTPEGVPGLEAALAARDNNPDVRAAFNLQRPDGSVSVDEKLAEIDPGSFGAGVLGATDTIALGFGDEIDAGMEATLGQGQIPFTDGWQDAYDQRVDDNRWLMRSADDLHGTATTVGRVAGALVLPSMAPLKGATLGQAAARMGAEGAVMGGIYGAGSADGDLTDRAIGAAKGATTGAVAGVVLSPIGYAAGRMAANPRQAQGRPVLDAADRLNAGVAKEEQIAPLPGHVGGQAVRIAHNVQEPALVGGRLSKLAGRSERYQENVGRALNRVAENVAGGGIAGPKPVLGLAEMASRANDKSVAGSMAHFADNFSQMSGAPYVKAGQLAGDTRLATPQTIAAIDDLLTNYRAVPGGVRGADDLQELRDTLAGGTWTVDGLRRLRTEFGTRLEAASGQTRAEANAMWASLSKDIFGGLRRAGKNDAANAYRHADRLYRENLTHLENIRKIIGTGQDSDAAIAARLARMGSNDAVRLGDAMNALPVEMRGEIQASILHNLGRKMASRATGDDEFSIETFATNWNKLDEQARHALVRHRAHRADLDAIAVLARADRRLHSKGNPSGTATTLNNIGEVGVLASGALGGPIGWKLLFGRYALGVALAQPAFARAMVIIAEKGPEAGLRALTRAARMAPMYSNEIMQFRDELERATVMPKEMDSADSNGTVSATNPFDQFDPEATTASQPAFTPTPGFPNLVTGQDGLTYDATTGVQVDISGL